MDFHVQHLASLCRIYGDKIEDHKCKVDTNCFVSEIHQILKDLFLLDSPNDPHQRQKVNFICKWCISLLIEHVLIIWDKMKTLQVRQKAKKAPDAWSQHETTQKIKQEKLINLNYFLYWHRTRRFSQLLQAGKTIAFDLAHHGHALVTLYFQFLCSDWSKFDRWVHAENLCWQSFCSTCDVFNCLFALDVQNEIKLLSGVF